MITFLILCAIVPAVLLFAYAIVKSAADADIKMEKMFKKHIDQQTKRKNKSTKSNSKTKLLALFILLTSFTSAQDNGKFHAPRFKCMGCYR